MSNNTNTPPTIRWQLLSTASAFALLTSTYAANASGNDADRPTLWIELGGQMENISGQGDRFAVGFLAQNPDSPVFGSTTPLQAQEPPKFSFGEEASISFQPENTDWVFAAAMRIGRSSNFRHVDHQTTGIFYRSYKYGAIVPGENIHGTDDFADTQVHHREKHTILDFSVGKDVGLGMFGNNSSSVLSAGVRFAQFSSTMTFDARARPDLAFKYQTFASAGLPSFALNLPHFHTYHLTGQASRSFRGVGPSLSWNGSAPVAGNPQDGEITIDWGANAAILFGKQKTHVRHGEVAHYFSPLAGFHGNTYSVPYQRSDEGHSTVRNVTAPNVGGFAGLSFRYQDAKISLGYRADFFLGAIDGGIDVRKSQTVGFKGPFASISIGMGD